MSRTSMQVQIKNERTKAEAAIINTLVADGYQQIKYGQELVWKKGTGVATAMHFIKYEISGDVLNIEGWVQIGVGDLGGKERDLKGFTAIIPKKSVLGTINRIKAVV